MEVKEEKNQHPSMTSFFSDRIINWWNKLDNEVVCATSVNAFKKRLQRMWERDEFVFGPYIVQ